MADITDVGTAERPNGEGGLASNQNYQVIIHVSNDEALTSSVASTGDKIFPIRANLPERFHLELQSNWIMPFDIGTAGEVAGDAAGAVGLGAASGFIQRGTDMALAAGGVGNKIRGQMIQTWESTGALELNLDLIFYAHSNTRREIKDRHLALLKLVAPSAGPGGVLSAPGPTIIGGVRGGRRIDLQIGTYLFMQNVIVRSVGSDMVSLMDENGIPIAMSINISVSTWNACVSAEDLEEMFYGARPNG